jgi:hypothetical protein
MFRIRRMAVYGTLLKFLNAPTSKTSSLFLSLVDIKHDNPFTTSLFILITLHWPSRSLRNYEFKMKKSVNVKTLEPKPVAKERKEIKRRTRIRGRYGFWRTIAKVFADGRHTECEHGADCTHHDGVKEHWGLVRLTLLCLCCKVEKWPHNHQTKVTKESKGGKTYEVAVGVAEWRDDGRHCFLCYEPILRMPVSERREMMFGRDWITAMPGRLQISLPVKRP